MAIELKPEGKVWWTSEDSHWKDRLETTGG